MSEERETSDSSCEEEGSSEEPEGKTPGRSSLQVFSQGWGMKQKARSWLISDDRRGPFWGRRVTLTS